MDVSSAFLIFLILFAFSVLFNFIILKWTKTLGTKNVPADEQPRWSSTYKPAVGGISFYIVFLLAYQMYGYFELSDPAGFIQPIRIGILICVSLAFIAGLADDAFNTVPLLKLSAQMMCGLILMWSGITIEFFNDAWLDGLLTVVWTVAVMNSINMLDNMDGVTTIVSIFILLMAAVSTSPFSVENVFFTLVSGGTVAALCGFLFFNWNPSRMFMGDTGSQMLGALLAAVGILFFWNNTNVLIGHHWWSKISVVMCAFAIPIADTLTVSINRIRKGQSPFVGGRDHTTHHLSYRGFSDRQVVYLLMGISAISLTLVYTLRFVGDALRYLVIALMFVYALAVIALLYRSTLHLTESSTLDHNNQ